MTTVTADVIESHPIIPKFRIEETAHGGFRVLAISEHSPDEDSVVLEVDTNSGDGSGRTVTLKAGNPSTSATDPYSGLDGLLSFLLSTEAGQSWGTLQADAIDLITKDLGNPAGSGRGVAINGGARVDGFNAGVDKGAPTTISGFAGRRKINHGLGRKPTSIHVQETEDNTPLTTDGSQAAVVPGLTTDVFFVVQWRGPSGAAAGNSTVRQCTWEAKVIVPG